MQGWRIFWQVLDGVLPVDHRGWDSLVEAFLACIKRVEAGQRRCVS